MGNLKNDPMDLARVAMPLVRLMRDANLSWSQKEEIAGVILQLCAERRQWEEESAHINGSAIRGLSGSNGVVL